MLVLLKALVPKLTPISGSTRADGVTVEPYMAVRHVLEPTPVETDPQARADLPAREPPEAMEPPSPVRAEPEAAGAFGALLAEIAALPPPTDPEIVAIEDRIDLADAMAENPHSDRTKRLLQIVARTHLDQRRIVL
jgi:hypothetical protein